MQYPLNQSSWRRAKQDTISAQKTARFMWGGESVLAVAGGTWLAQIAPTGAPTLEIVVRSVIGVLGGLVITILLIFIWNLFRAPYRHLNEAIALLMTKPKPVRLANRQELFIAIHHLQETASETILRHDAMRNRRDIGAPYNEELAAYNAAYMAYFDAEKQLETQTAIAGQSFKKHLTAFQNTIKAYVYMREIPNVPDYSEMIIKLKEAVEEVEADMDAISQ